MWYMVFILWLLAPLGELAVIVGLGVVSYERKKRIQELEAELRGEGRQYSGGTMRKEAPIQPSQIAGQTEGPQALVWAEPGDREKNRSIGKDKRDSGKKPHEGMRENHIGILALLAGVVFMVLAGLVFATTAWQILSSLTKVLLVLAFSLMFFFVSYLAEKRLNIHKTGNGLYVLGSIFLFLTVLAAAYFQLLGPEYILVGQNRWKVLWIGSLVTVTMLFLGVGRFRDRIYIRVCFGGMTVSMTFLALAHGLNRGIQWLSAMMIYAWLLISGKWLLRKWALKGASDQAEKRSGFEPSGTEEQESTLELVRKEFSWFASVHFWIFSIPVVFLGIAGGMFSVKPWLCWYLALALAAVLMGTGLEIFQKPEEGNKSFFCLSLAGAVHYYFAWISDVTAGGQNWSGTGALVLAGMLVALMLLMESKRNYPWRTVTGERIGMAFLVFDAALPGCQAFLVQIFGEAGEAGLLRAYAFWALAAALVLLVVMTVWRKKILAAEWMLPLLWGYVVLWPLNLWLRCEISYRMAENWSRIGLNWLDRGILGFLMLAGMILWERKRHEGYFRATVILGTGMGMAYFSEKQVMCPFFLLLAGYLLAKAWQREAGSDADRISRKRQWLCRAAAVYGMLGVNHLLFPFGANNRMLRLMGMLAVYVAGLFLERTWEREKYETEGRSLFWDIWGCFLMVLIIGECCSSCYHSIFYGVSGSGNGTAGHVALCLAVFAGFYLMFYRGKRIWPHLLISIGMMPVPLVLAQCYDWTEDRLYLTVLGALLVTAAAARRFCRIAEPDKEVFGGWRVDWYHVTAIFLLILMAGISEEEYWRFICLMYLSVYILQFGGIGQWRRIMWSGMGLLWVLAYWSQPFFLLPSWIKLELQLLPAASYLWYLGKVWGKRGKNEAGEKEAEEKEKGLEIFQTFGYCLCLLILTIHVWLWGKVANALILEGICLILFVWGLMKRKLRWIGIAGTILILVALYMTKNFWLSISWWVYLLAAGIGLLVFAAVSEKRKKG